MKPTPKKLKLSMKKVTITELGANTLDKVAAGGTLVTDTTCTFCDSPLRK